jgi:putative spermidine/putrescine transport system substrate-binding protein
MMQRSLYLAGALAAVGLTAAALMPTKPALAGDQLTITSWGGAYQMSQRKAYFEPYAKQASTKITEEEYNGEIAKIRAMVEAKSVNWDVVDVDSGRAIQGCSEGVLETIDWAKVGVDRAKLTGADKYDCAVPTILYATVIAYDKDKMPNGGPQTIADLFDTAKFPGKRGLQKDPAVNLEWALIADGVPSADVYKVLATPEGIARAFKKLDTIKKDVVWWEAGAQPPQLLADGQVVMTSAWNGRIFDANKNSGKHFAIMWDNQFLDWDLWAIPKGDPRLDDAYKFIAFASSPDAQADQTHYISYGPANQDAIAHVDPAILPNLPTAPDNMKTAVLLDAGFWGDHGDDLRQRFTAWLAQ